MKSPFVMRNMHAEGDFSLARDADVEKELTFGWKTYILI